MIETIRYAEYEWFLWLNSFHSSFFDTIMYWVTHRFTWIPLYIFLIYYIFGIIRKNAWYKLLFILISVGLSDRITSGLMKPYFQRFRPCHDPAIENLVHVVGGCGGQYGFASSHAANSFALALAFSLFNTQNIRLKFFLFLWAILVSYSRIYVGVHYPTDLIVGAIVGMVITMSTYFIIIKFNQKLLT
ncbi:phosphatase PAP2 family protein [Emticicia sp. BO119]|uniref:phosphatase PAP2 family protein n=1 Tax=Emticicia sp. BO119 TaxID=2757768 RepID=UPI0015F000FF|nr:phosphatase PAP2 family protein [Emticicia sp. BO119]MBA4853547.1 phosphatase PAP2 family protein [Emticicia sp. BO119]